MDEILKKKKRESTKFEEWNHHRNLIRFQKRESIQNAKDGYLYANDNKNKQTIKILHDSLQLLPGIANLGNACYVASIIQLLFNSSIYKFLFNQKTIIHVL